MQHRRDWNDKSRVILLVVRLFWWWCFFFCCLFPNPSYSFLQSSQQKQISCHGSEVVVATAAWIHTSKFRECHSFYPFTRKMRTSLSSASFFGTARQGKRLVLVLAGTKSNNNDDNNELVKDCNIKEEQEGDSTVKRSTSVAGTSCKPKTRKKRPSMRIITCSSTKEMIDAVSTYIKPGHVVAELGSQLRDVSTAICHALSPKDEESNQQLLLTNKNNNEEEEMDKKSRSSCSNSGFVTFVDIKRTLTEPQQQKKADLSSPRTNAMRLTTIEPNDFYPSISTFIEIPHLEDWRHAFFGTTRSSPKYNIFVLDLNKIVGNDLEWTSLSIVNEFDALNKNNNNNQRQSNVLTTFTNQFDDDNENENEENFIVLVKSVALNQWAGRLMHGQRWILSNDNNNKKNIIEQRKQSRGTKRSGRPPPPPFIVATRGVQEYRDTIPYTVHPGDAVLEVGCHCGTSTILLQQQATMTGTNTIRTSSNRDGNDNEMNDIDDGGYCIGIDVGAKIIREANKRYPTVFFRVGNAWRTAELLRIQQDYYEEQSQQPHLHQRIGFDVVYIDVGGLSGSDGLLEALTLISSIRYALEPRCIVIKSLCMKRLSSSLEPYWKLQKQQQQRHQNDSN